MLAVLCALGSSLLYALASVLQQRGAAAQPEEQSMRLGLLVRLIRNPAWMVGLGADAGGYVLQFLALGHGAIVVVQLLLVCGLLFALPLGAFLADRRLTGADWLGAAAVCAGLATFLLVSGPSEGRPDTSGVAWVALLGSTMAVAAVLALGARRASLPTRAVLLSAGAGTIYASAAALTKTASHLLDHGVVRMLVQWQTYGLAVTAVIGMLMAQSAFQAGVLDVSLPTMTVVDPVVSLVIGAAAFGETVHGTAGARVLEGGALVAMSVGVFVLARSRAGAAVRVP